MTDALGWTLLHFLWQGALIGCVTAIGLTALRNARAEYRYNVACAALLACLAWPALTLYGRLAEGSAIASGMARIVSGPGLVAGSFAAQCQHQLPWIVAAWAVCCAALTVRTALGLFWIERVSRRASTAAPAHWQQRLDLLARQFGIGRHVALRVVDELASPITAGWLRPVVLVPAALVTGMPPELLEALLAHEMAHVQRFDYLVNLGQNAIEILLFYHPAVWWISGRIRVEREQIADDIAARKLGEPRSLALALSELEKLQFSRHSPALAANGGELMSRIKRLVRPDTEALDWKAALPVMGLALALSACASAPQVKHEPVVVAAVVDFKSCAKPVWPAESLKREETGTVRLEFTVSAQGKVVGSTLFRSSGHPALDEAAREGINKCAFKPGTRDGVPVESTMKMMYIWTLK
ncbi:MAG: M56 family metallopeptidase [Pseudomonadota bacterium]